MYCTTIRGKSSRFWCPDCCKKLQTAMGVECLLLGSSKKGHPAKRVLERPLCRGFILKYCIQVQLSVPSSTPSLFAICNRSIYRLFSTFHRHYYLSVERNKPFSSVHGILIKSPKVTKISRSATMLQYN